MSSQVPDGPDPSSQGGGGGGRGPSGQSSASASNLYLVTFLATLFLLLFISCAIILRSYILRRRYQRHLDMVSGLLLTPRSQGSRHGRFGHVPKMFDSWIMSGGRKWKDMRPVAAQPVFVKRKRKDAVGLKTARIGQLSLSTLESSNTHPPYRGRSPFSRFRRLQDTTMPPEEIEHPQHSPPPSTSRTRVEMLQISVLIAMPSRNRVLRKNALLDSVTPEDDDEPPLPELALGITKVPYRHKVIDAISTPQPSSHSDIPAS